MLAYFYALFLPSFNVIYQIDIPEFGPSYCGLKII